MLNTYQDIKEFLFEIKVRNEFDKEYAIKLLESVVNDFEDLQEHMGDTLEEFSDLKKLIIKD